MGNGMLEETSVTLTRSHHVGEADAGSGTSVFVLS